MATDDKDNINLTVDDIDEEEPELLTSDEYVATRPDVDPVDMLLGSMTFVNSTAPKPEIESDLLGTFTHGLTMHHMGTAPDSIFSTEGLAYLAGAFIPLASYNRAAFAIAPKLQMGLRYGFAGRPAKGVIGPQPAGYKLPQAIDAAVASKQFEFGTRVSLEAGMWAATDKHLEGAEGLKDALLYTAIGEGLFAGISRTAKAYKRSTKASQLRKDRLETRGKKAETAEYGPPTQPITRETGEAMTEEFADLRTKLETGDLLPDKTIDLWKVSDKAMKVAKEGKYNDDVLGTLDEVEALTVEMQPASVIRSNQAKAYWSVITKNTADDIDKMGYVIDDKIKLTTKEGELVETTSAEVTDIVNANKRTVEEEAVLNDLFDEIIKTDPQVKPLKLEPKGKTVAEKKVSIEEQVPGSAAVVEDKIVTKSKARVNKILTPKNRKRVMANTGMTMDDLARLPEPELTLLKNARKGDEVFTKYKPLTKKAKQVQKKIKGKTLEEVNDAVKQAKETNKIVQEDAVKLDPYTLYSPPIELKIKTATTTVRKTRKTKKVKLAAPTTATRPKSYRTKPFKRVKDKHINPVNDTSWHQSQINSAVYDFISTRFGLQGYGKINEVIDGIVKGDTKKLNLTELQKAVFNSPEVGNFKINVTEVAEEAVKKQDVISKVVRGKYLSQAKKTAQEEIDKKKAEFLAAGGKIEKFPAVPVDMKQIVRPRTKKITKEQAEFVGAEGGSIYDTTQELLRAQYDEYERLAKTWQSTWDNVFSYGDILRRAAKVHGYHNIGKDVTDEALTELVKKNIPKTDAEKIFRTADDLHNNGLNAWYRIYSAFDPYANGMATLPSNVKTSIFETFFERQINKFNGKYKGELELDSKGAIDKQAKVLADEEALVIKKTNQRGAAPGFKRKSDGKSYAERILKKRFKGQTKNIAKIEQAIFENKSIKTVSTLGEYDPVVNELIELKGGYHYIKGTDLEVTSVPKKFRDKNEFLPHIIIKPGAMSMDDYVKAWQANAVKAYKQNMSDAPELTNVIQKETTKETPVTNLKEPTTLNAKDLKHDDAYKNITNGWVGILKKAITKTEYDKLPPAKKDKAIVLSKQLISAMILDLNEAVSKHEIGNLSATMLGQYIPETVLKRLKLYRRLDRLADMEMNQVTIDAAMDARNIIEEEALLKIFGIKNGKGAHRELVRKQKHAENMAKNMDEVEKPLAEELLKKQDRLVHLLERLSRITDPGDLVTLKRMELLGGALEKIGSIESVNFRAHVRRMKDEARRMMDEADQLRPGGKKKGRSKKYVESTRKDLYGKAVDTELTDNLPAVMKKMHSEDIKKLDDIDMNNVDMDYLVANRELLESTFYSLIDKQIIDWVDNFSLAQFKTIFNEAMKSGDKVAIAKVKRDFVSHLMTNQDDFYNIAAQLNKKGKVEAKLYEMVRGAYGFNPKATLKIHDMVHMQSSFNALNFFKIESKINNPTMSKIDIPGNATEVKAGKEAIGDQSGAPPDRGPDAPGGGEAGGTGAGGTGGVVREVQSRGIIGDALLHDAAYQYTDFYKLLEPIVGAAKARVLLDLAQATGEGLIKLKRNLARESIDFENSAPYLYNKEGNIGKTLEKLEAKYGNKLDAEVLAPARKLADDITETVQDMRAKGKNLDEMQKYVDETLANAPEGISEYLGAWYKNLDEVRIVNNKKIVSVNKRRGKGTGLPLLKEIGYIPGYFPHVADGAFDIKLLGQQKPFASATSKEEAYAMIKRFLAENPDEARDIIIQPAYQGISDVVEPAMGKSLLNEARIPATEVRELIKGINPATGKQVKADTVVDVMFKNTKGRGLDMMDVPRKQFDDAYNQYIHGVYKYGDYADMITTMRLAQKELADAGLIAEANYVNKHMDIMLDRPQRVEKAMVELTDNMLEQVQKVPVVSEAFKKLGLAPGTGAYRSLSNLITSTGSFVALGFNIATSILQLSILGMNVIPRLGFKHFVGAFRDARLIMKPGTKANKEYYKLVKDLGLDINVNEGRIDDVIRAMHRAGDDQTLTGLHLRQYARKIKDWSMIPFNGMDRYARLVTLIAAKRRGTDIARRVAGKIREHKLAGKDYAEVAEYLTQTERTLYEQALRMGKNVEDPDILNEFAKRFMRDTNFVYDKSNVPFAFNDPTFAPILQFKTWVQKETMFFVRSMTQRPKALKGAAEYEEFMKITGAFVALGGVFSLPGAQEFDLLSRTMFGWSPKKEMYEKDSPFMDILAGGAPMGMGVSMEGRMGPGSIFQLVDVDNLFGIYPTRLWKGSHALLKGQVDRGMNYLMPRFAQNLIQGFNIANTGKLMSTYDGDLIFDFNDMNVNPLYGAVLKSMGFETPDETRARVVKFGLLSHSKKTGRQIKLAKWRAYRYLDEGNYEDAYEIFDLYNLDRKTELKKWRDKTTVPEARRKPFPHSQSDPTLEEDVDAYRQLFK